MTVDVDARSSASGSVEASSDAVTPVGPGRGRRVAARLIRPAVIVVITGLLYAYVAGQDLDSIEQRSLNTSTLTTVLRQHLLLTLYSTFFVLLIAVSAGLLLTRKFARPLAGPVLTVANIGQSAPSIGVIVLLTFAFGIGTRTAVIALVAYSLLPVLRNTIVGIEGVDASLIDAGRGMGMTGIGVLARVELPLAVPVILAGIRTALVLNVGTATLATFINGGGLGDLIVTGIKLNRQPILLTGAVLTAVLALLVDYIAGLVQELLTPKGLS